MDPLTITVMIAPLVLSLSREARVVENHSLTPSRIASELASSGFSGSSMMMMSPPRPVSVPPIDVARRPPPSVVSKSAVAVRCALMMVRGNARRYQSDCMIALQSRANFVASSPE